MERKRRILVAPLDWGLGHATRCIPVISALIKRNAEVIIAGSGSAAELLKREFPEQKHFLLPGYNPHYGANNSMVWQMAIQLPGFIKTIRQEHAAINELAIREKIDVIISDNRYGCYSARAKSIFITHQINILMPSGFKWMEGLVNRFNHEQINKFTECWVPAKNTGILGDLMPVLPLHTRFIGYLSRFKKLERESKYAIAAIASGPEPQRTMLCNILRNELKEAGVKAFLLRGEIASEETREVDGSLEEVNYLLSSQLNNIIEQSDLIIARSGYSTIMDLARLGKKAIFIPTPGQTEQEYLAEQLLRQNVAFSMRQADFNLKTALKEANKFGGFANFDNDEILLDQAIQSIL